MSTGPTLTFDGRELSQTLRLRQWTDALILVPSTGGSVRAGAWRWLSPEGATMGCVAWGRSWSGTSKDPTPAWVREQRVEFQAIAQRTFTPERLVAVSDLPEPLRTVKEAADRVGHDVAVTTGLELDYHIIGPEADGSYVCGNGPSVSYMPGDDLEEYVAAPADVLSEWVCETLGNLGRIEEALTWPRCPAHEHSLDPVESEGIAVWRCRDDPSIVVRVGDLPSVL